MNFIRDWFLTTGTIISLGITGVAIFIYASYPLMGRIFAVIVVIIMIVTGVFDILLYNRERKRLGLK